MKLLFSFLIICMATTKGYSTDMTREDLFARLSVETYKAMEVRLNIPSLNMLMIGIEELTALPEIEIDEATRALRGQVTDLYHALGEASRQYRIDYETQIEIIERQIAGEEIHRSVELTGRAAHYGILGSIPRYLPYAELKQCDDATFLQLLVKAIKNCYPT